MDRFTLIIGLASLGYILIGMFVMKNKAVSKNLENEELSRKNKEFTKKTGMTNIVTGAIGLVIAVVNYFVNIQSIFIVLAFILLVSISTLIQFGLGKNYTNSLQK